MKTTHTAFKFELGYRFHISSVKFHRLSYFPRLYISHTKPTLWLDFGFRLYLHNLRIQFFRYLSICKPSFSIMDMCFGNLKSFQKSTYSIVSSQVFYNHKFFENDRGSSVLTRQVPTLLYTWARGVKVPLSSRNFNTITDS